MTHSQLTWLPNRHLGVAATLSHADELIGQVGDLLFAYQTKAEGVVGLKEIIAGKVSQTVVDHVAPIPRKVSLLVADALVALRAALEHTLFAEVVFLDGGPLDEKAAKLVEIPAADTFEKFVDWTKKRTRNGPSSLRAGGALTRRIEQLQPFQRQVEPHLHPLARLVLHTNHAKHRMPVVTAVRLAAMYEDGKVPHSVRDLPPRPEEPLRMGDIIAETPLGTRNPVTLFPTVGINRPGTDRWPLLMQELEEISRWVRTQALPRLITGSEPPTTSLPTRYKIGVGHEDERTAIHAGTWTTAGERFTQRLTAASARIDLSEMIGNLEDSLSAQRVAVWLDHLTDEDVLERVGRLQLNFNYDLDIMLRNVQVLRGILDEAWTFTPGCPAG